MELLMFGTQNGAWTEVNSTKSTSCFQGFLINLEKNQRNIDALLTGMQEERKQRTSSLFVFISHTEDVLAAPIAP